MSTVATSELALAWRKSSHSGPEGDNCVEVALTWRKSSHSGPEGDSCVEVATSPGVGPGTVHVRDSKDTQGPQLAFAPGQWAAFVGYAAARA